MSRTVTMKGNPLPLVGAALEVGQKAPDFTVLDNALSPVSLSSAEGKIRVLVSVPSLDTGVCDLEVRRFNEEATKLGDKVEVWAISMDLPFAQARWCGAAGVERVKTLSDHKDAAFGQAFGLTLEPLRLLARAVVIVDGEGMVRYQQLVPEVTDEPDYDAVIRAIQDVQS